VKKGKDLRVKSCYLNGTTFMFVLEGQAAPGKVVQLVVRKDGKDIPMALVEIAEWDSEGDLIAYTIWLDREQFWNKPPDVFVYPTVRVTCVDRRTLERYMKSEGQQGITRVFHNGQKSYIVHRLGHKVGGYGEPWICILLDGGTSEFSIIVKKATLAEMKEFLINLIPESTKEVSAWGYEGCKIYDLVKYGALADGITDDTNVVLRVLDLVKTGDVITLAGDRRIKMRSGVMIPNSVILDIRDDQIVVERQA
jgi:hypothetical protein